MSLGICCGQMNENIIIRTLAILAFSDYVWNQNQSCIETDSQANARKYTEEQKRMCKVSANRTNIITQCMHASTNHYNTHCDGVSSNGYEATKEPPCRLAERTKGVDVIQSMTAFVFYYFKMMIVRMA